MGLVCRVCARVNGRDRVDAEERADRQNKNVVVFHVRFFIGLVKRRRAKGARRRDVGNQIARVRRFESSPSLISRQSTSRLKLTALGDLHRARRRTGLRPDGFDRLDDVHALAHGAEHDVLPVQPARRRRAQEELRPVRARSSVRHGQNSRTGVLELKVFILKLVPVDGFTPRAVVVGEIAALAHESRDDAVEARSLVPEALFPGTQRSEVFYAHRVIARLTVSLTVASRSRRVASSQSAIHHPIIQSSRHAPAVLGTTSARSCDTVAHTTHRQSPLSLSRESSRARPSSRVIDPSLDRGRRTVISIRPAGCPPISTSK